MTQDEIIEMAREVGMEQDGDMWFSNLYKTDMDVHISHLEAFAKLVAAKEQKKWEDQTAVEIHEAVLEEREACAKVCDEFNFGQAPMMIQRAIKTRGEQT